MRRLFSLLFTLIISLTLFAQSRRAVELSTDVTMFVPSLAGAVVAIVEKDYEGMWQLVGSGATSIAAAYALKYTISKERPDGSDNHSFPSNHTGFAFMGATFIGQRYGWKYSIPAYLVSGYTAWGRIHSKRHDFWDVLAGAAIGNGCALLITSPFASKNKLSIMPYFPADRGAGFHATLQF
jgi:membrane-associated phospholipid phosphatase